MKPLVSRVQLAFAIFFLFSSLKNNSLSFYPIYSKIDITILIKTSNDKYSFI